MSASFACAALVLVLGATPAIALQVAGSAPELVTGVVSSVHSRIVPETGAIVTDVTVLNGQSGTGSGTSSFTMRGGEVGDLGMWSEGYTPLQIGDTVVAGVAELEGQAMAVQAPTIGAGLTQNSLEGLNVGVDAVAAGYIYEGIRWPDESLPAGYYVNPSGLPDGAVSSINAAAQTWENDPGSYMDFSYLGVSSAAPGSFDGVNVIGMGDLGVGPLAVCQYWYTLSAKRILQFDITFNTANYPFATVEDPTSYDVQAIGTHELGHTLNLKDMYDDENADQVMYGYGNPGETSSRTLKWGDIAGIYAIYPNGAGGTVKPVWRFRNLKNGYYLFSADPFEKLIITSYFKETWALEGEAYQINTATNTMTLWRFRNIKGGYYLYTADVNEKNKIIATLGDVWQLEGPAYGVSRDTNGLLVWRFRNRLDGTYLLSADPVERANIITNLHSTWVSEGPAFYIAP